MNMKISKINKVLAEAITFLSLIYEGLVILQKLMNEVINLI